MRIVQNSLDKAIRINPSILENEKIESNLKKTENLKQSHLNHPVDKGRELNLESISKEKLDEAVTAINDFLEVEKKSTKFVLHDGLDKYYVRLIDPETEEVIKEIPPESLLNAFYEMKKLAGMIVDEKI